jgi:hypothetical protein
MALPLIAGAIAAPIIGGLIGADQANKDRRAADAARNQALAQFANIDIPDIEKQKLALQEYQLTGILTPEVEALINLGPSAMEGISLDPAARQKQLEALEQMSGLASGQVQPGDIAAFELAKREAGAYDQAKQGQILQEMQQRGQGGSGAELLARLKSSQSSADRLNQAGLEQAKQMQNARMAALQAQSNMAGNLRSQDYGQETDLAKAKDMISQFNAQNAQSVGSRNTGIRNDAQKYNLQNTQNTANMNTELANKQQIHNKGLQQNQFDNSMSLAGAKAGMYGQQADAAQQQAGQTAAMWGGIGQGVGTGLSSFVKK